LIRGIVALNCVTGNSAINQERPDTDQTYRLSQDWRRAHSLPDDCQQTRCLDI